MPTGASPGEQEEEKKHSALPVLSQGAVLANVGSGTQHLNTSPFAHRQAAEAPRATDAEALPAQLQQMMRAMEEQMRHMFAEQQQQLQHQLHSMQQQLPAATAGAAQSRAAASGRRQTVGFPSHPLSPTADEYSAGATLPLPPRVPARHRRGASIGVPSTPAAHVPLTPLTRTAAAAHPTEEDDRSDNEHEDAAVGGQTDSEEAYMPPRDKRMEHVRKSMLHSVKPFHGRTQQDTYTVIDWVEKVDTEFSIHMGDRQAGRMDVVRSLLAGQALKWANRRVAEMNALDEEAEWQNIRADFINAHLGDSTIETFKAELRALRLGTGDNECKTPSELNTQFDRLAELAYPMALGLTDRRAEGAMATVLGDEYRRIVADSQPFLWKNIERALTPATLEEWKLALAKHWSAERIIQSMRKPPPPVYNSPPQYGRGGGAARGGRGRGGGSNGSNQANLSAALEDTQADERGEGEPDTQLSAASDTRGGHGGGRGGRGGGRGRGGRGGRQPMSPVIQKLYNEGRCFTCGETGHVQAACSQRAQPSQPQQGKVAAE